MSAAHRLHVSPLVVATALLALGLSASGAAARAVPQLSRRVTDEAGVLGGAAERLEQRLSVYAQQTGHQLAVLVIPGLEGEVLEQYSVRVAEQWRLGDKARDDGLLLVVAMEDRAIRIEVGYGLEGAVTDAASSRIIRDVMIPRFQASDPAGGIEAGVEALMKAAQGEALGPAPASSPRVPGGGQLWPILAVVFFALLSVPRPVRALLFLFIGSVGGWLWSQSILLAVACGLGAAVLGLVLPVLRGRRGRGGFIPIPWIGGGRGGGWSSGGGGFSGGGGGFGGGGASGRW